MRGADSNGLGLGQVITERSNRSVLTMTFEADLIRVDAAAALAAAHLSPGDCGDLIADVFAGEPQLLM